MDDLVPGKEPWSVVRLLAITQIISWGSLYYAFAILGPDIQHELGWSTGVVFGAFSWSLLVAGLAATPVGALIDRHGGRRVMCSGSILAGIGLLILALANSVAMYFIAWTCIGVAMAMVLYEAAFATINREFLHDGRKGISILSLFGGLASTVFWPLTLYLGAAVGWRDTLLIYAAMHLLLCAPMHGLLGANKGKSDRMLPQTGSHTLSDALREPAFWHLACAFSANMFIFSALSVHLIPLLQRFGHSPAVAVMAAALIGPMQVAGRLGELSIARRLDAGTIGKLTFSMLPPALLSLIFLGENQVAVAVFCMLYGLSNGVLTIVRGSVPLVLFGRQNYGAISGALAGPALLAKAAGPIAAASYIGYASSAKWLLGSLLFMSVLSLGFFLAALRARSVTPAARAE